MGWISENEGAKRLGIARKTFKKVAAAASIRRQVLPGMGGLVRFDEADVERVGRESVIEAGQVARVAS